MSEIQYNTGTDLQDEIRMEIEATLQRKRFGGIGGDTEANYQGRGELSTNNVTDSFRVVEENRMNDENSDEDDEEEEEEEDDDDDAFVAWPSANMGNSFRHYDDDDENDLSTALTSKESHSQAEGNSSVNPFGACCRRLCFCFPSTGADGPNNQRRRNTEPNSEPNGSETTYEEDSQCNNERKSWFKNICGFGRKRKQSNSVDPNCHFEPWPDGDEEELEDYAFHSGHHGPSVEGDESEDEEDDASTTSEDKEQSQTEYENPNQEDNQIDNANAVSQLKNDNQSSLPPVTGNNLVRRQSTVFPIPEEDEESEGSQTFQQYSNGKYKFSVVGLDQLGRSQHV